MRWFRSQRRLGAWAALFALAVQLIVSFGHVHVGHAATPSLLAASIVDGAAGGATPHHPGSHHPADDLCAICLVSGLIGSAQVAAPPVVPLPVVLAGTELSPPSRAAPAGQRRVAFRSRAPPQA